MKRFKHYLLSFLIQVSLSGFFVHDWDGFVFKTSAEQLLYGVSPYAIAATDLAYKCAPFQPMIDQWYAYPPVPIMMYTLSFSIYHILLFGSNLILERLFLKLPFILGNLMCASLIYRMTDSEAAEKLTLYNPYLIFIASIWGMFDVWIVNFLLLGIMNIDKVKTGGLYFGLACLIKLLPVILGPIFLIRIWNKTGRIRDLIIFTLSSAGVFALVSLPFFLETPKAYINQILLMHLSRPPQELAFMGSLYIEGILDYLLNGSRLEFLYTYMPAIFSGIFMGVTGLIFLHYFLKKDTGISTLITTLFLVILSFLLFNKVVNPQYFVIPIALSILLIYQGFDEMRGLYSSMTWYMLVIALVTGCHFATFIPVDISLPICGWSATKVLSDYIVESGIPLNLFYASTLVVGLSAFYIMLYRILRYILKSIKDAIKDVSEELSIHRFRGHISQERVTAVIILFLLLIPTGMAIRTTPEPEPDTSVYSYTSDDKLVGVFYYIWWNNPSHNPTIKVDSWIWVNVTPQDGYYESSRGYIEQDIKQMKDVGIDFLVVSFHEYGQERQRELVKVCEEHDFKYAPFIELLPIRYLEADRYDAVDREGNVIGWQLGFKRETADKLVKIISKALEYQESPSYLRIENKPVVFLCDDHQFAPGWSDEEKEYMVDGLYEMLEARYNLSDDNDISKLLSDRWRKNIRSKEDALTYYPRNILCFEDPRTLIEWDWFDAFGYNYRRFWTGIHEEVEDRYGDIYWIGSDYTTGKIIGRESLVERQITINDNCFAYGIGNIFTGNYENQTRAFEIWDDLNYEVYHASDEYGFPLIVTVVPHYDDRYIREHEPINLGHPVLVNESIVGGSLYDYTWEKVFLYNASIVLISTWNEHYETSGIEPTIEYGDMYLRKTEEMIERFKYR